MTHRFRSNTDSSSDWLMCSFGRSCSDNIDYHLTSNSLKADEVPDIMQDAKTSSEFVAGLLNAYFAGVNVAGISPEKVCAMGGIEDNPNQTEINF